MLFLFCFLNSSYNESCLFSMVQCCNSSLSKVACTPFSSAASTSSSFFQGKTRVSHLYSEVTKSQPCQTLTPSELTLGFGEDYNTSQTVKFETSDIPDLWSPVLAPALGSMLRSTIAATNTLEYQIKLVVVHYDCM